jgi:hypothetical protein
VAAATRSGKRAGGGTAAGRDAVGHAPRRHAEPIGPAAWPEIRRGWAKFKGMDMRGPSLSKMDRLIIALGFVRDRRATPVIVAELRREGIVVNHDTYEIRTR